MIDFLDFVSGIDVSNAFKKFEISQKEVMIVKNVESGNEIKYYKAFINK